MNARTTVFTLVALAALASPLSTARADASPTRSLSPYFVVDGEASGVEGFALESTRVHANVSGVIADVVVEQTYRNRGRLPIHARYVFPASTRAAVHGMSMRVGTRRVVAQIRERQQAAREFEVARAAGRTASLLEQQRPNVFSMAIANILPTDVVVVELHYNELLVPTDGVYQFVYPTVVGPRYSRGGGGEGEAGGATGPAAGSVPYLREGASPDTTFEIDVTIGSGTPLGDVRSSSHRVDVDRTGANAARVALTAGEGFAGNRDFILDYTLAGERIASGLLLYETPAENHFLLMVQPPARVRAEDIPAREYIFVFDVSGSMGGFPLDTGKALIRDLISHLRPTDTFDLILFSGDQRTMSPSSVPATPANVRRAIAIIDDERGGGGTELDAALQEAEAIPRTPNVSRSVVLLTDGFIAEEREAFTRVSRNVNRTNVFAFGIGSSVNRHLIEGVARAGQGEPFIVTKPDEAAAVAARFRRYIESPVLTDVDVSFPGFDAYEVEPARQADLFAERPIVVVGKWRGARRGTIVVTGRTPSGRFESRADVSTTSSRPENSALPLLWARSKIARLADVGIDGDDARAAEEVTALGLRYSLLTRYTSFIAVVEEIRNPGGVGAESNQPVALPQGVSELAVGGSYSNGAEPELWLLVALFGVIAAFRMVRRPEESAAR